MGENKSVFRLLEGEGVEGSGQFSPDGRWVAYTSKQSGLDQVNVVPFLGPASQSVKNTAPAKEKWQISLSGGRQPRWRRDGKELFYVAADNMITAVPVNIRGSKFDIGTPHPLFRATPLLDNFYYSYDVSPDGNRFIINTAAEERSAPITLVENWPSDFKK
jgi:hypothetical protein